MNDDIVRVYRIHRRIKCYIRKDGDHFMFCSGKPSDGECLSWHCDTPEEAEERADKWIRGWKELYMEISQKAEEDWE